MELGLREKVVIVTGASAGIGRQIACDFAKEGARVVIAGRAAAGVQATLDAIRSNAGEAVAVQADLRFADGADRVFEETIAAFGRLDILVNNAAWVPPRTHLLELDEDHWDQALTTNLKSIYLCTARAARIFAAQGGGGAVVSLTSLGASRGHRMMSAYDASKGGVEAFTRAAALDLAPFGIRVNAICPGWIRNEKFDLLDAAAKQRRNEEIPLGRLGNAGDVAAAAAFLCSDGASYITGQILSVDGGVGVQLRTPSTDAKLPETWSPHAADTAKQHS
jgi:NAD(P)-dependent dehydrogenase (short-subunit alcohol dehydrogenase family)